MAQKWLNRLRGWFSPRGATLETAIVVRPGESAVDYLKQMFGGIDYWEYLVHSATQKDGRTYTYNRLVVWTGPRGKHLQGPPPIDLRRGIYRQFTSERDVYFDVTEIGGCPCSTCFEERTGTPWHTPIGTSLLADRKRAGTISAKESTPPNPADASEDTLPLDVSIQQPDDPQSTHQPPPAAINVDETSHRWTLPFGRTRTDNDDPRSRQTRVTRWGARTEGASRM